MVEARSHKAWFWFYGLPRLECGGPTTHLGNKPLISGLISKSAFPCNRASHSTGIACCGCCLLGGWLAVDRRRGRRKCGVQRVHVELHLMQPAEPSYFRNIFKITAPDHHDGVSSTSRRVCIEPPAASEQAREKWTAASRSGNPGGAEMVYMATTPLTGLPLATIKLCAGSAAMVRQLPDFAFKRRHRQERRRHMAAASFLRGSQREFEVGAPRLRVCLSAPLAECGSVFIHRGASCVPASDKAGMAASLRDCR
ncbi:hypothetical protein P154DRAFT_579302 [Amniculicola lignicola CBS 123094]|uniref:Uncharacterized protein n=1 Tax=Amniculicola lignicola CBS 123094 TaxID=1392246 RepID=A0A6A5WA03_9PLEO|nr:hypothetical protein P154DRAFT_579302 [Amniculicola lignicola CBS 123094]